MDRRRQRNAKAWTVAAATVLIAAAAVLSAAPPAAATRADFWHLIDRPRVPLDAVERPLASADPAVAESHVTFTSEPGQPVPVLTMKPVAATGRLPVVIVLHGTGGTKEGNRSMMALLVHAGFLAVAPDGRFHGERCPAGRGTAAYDAAIAQAYRDGRSHPWLYDSVFDVTRLIDYLQTRPDVDARRIGLMGFSKGGMETYLTAAIDPRVAAAVPCIAIQDFRWELDHDAWHRRIGTVQAAYDAAAKQSGADPKDPRFVQQFYDRVIPGIDGEFDCPAMLPLIAPRPLLAVSGADDPINPLPSAEIAAAEARAAYAAAGVPDRFDFVVQPKVGHDVKPKYRQQIAAWFAKQLRGPTTDQ
jgi:dienelactone hydrolase